MKTAVVYRSHYGSTERYARWLAEETGAALMDARRVNPQMLAPYDCVVFGGGLYAGSVAGMRRLAKLYSALREKRLAVFTVGLADPADPKTAEKIMQDLGRTLPPEMLAGIRVFHLRGAMDYAHMQPVHKAMMAMLRRMLLQKPPEQRTEDDRKLLAAYDRPVDFTAREALAPLLAFCREA